MAGILEVIIILGFVYWLYNNSASTMIDVISTRVHDAYTGLRQRSLTRAAEADSGPGTRLTGAALRRAAAQPRRQYIADRQIGRMLKEKSLYKIMETPATLAVTPMKRPFVGISCSKCAPNSANTNRTDSQNVINILELGYMINQQKGFMARSFCDIAQVFRVKRFDYKQASETVLSDERFRQQLQQMTDDALEKQKTDGSQSPPRDCASIYKSLENRARIILKDMRSTISDFLLRLTSYTLYKVLPYFVSKVVASPEQISVLRKAGDSGLPLVFVPLHRSHLDYILVSFILLNYDVRSPIVAAGDNLKIPLFGWLLRGLGAFYIKRRLDTTGSEKDLVYRATLHTYMMHCLRARHNIEFFIEGGRSRTGKPQLPKGGILSVIVDAYLDGTIEDAILVPVSMNYEKLVDGNFVREQLGVPKQMESFGAAIKAIWNVFNSHYGSIRIDFNQPFSMRELVQSFRKPSQMSLYPEIVQQQEISIAMFGRERTLTANSSCASLYGTDCVQEDQKGLVEAIARHVVYDCTNATAIMSTNALAFLLLTRFRGGCSLADLAASLDGLALELIRDGRSMGFIGDSVDVVNHAIKILGPGLVLKEHNEDNVIVKPVSILPNVIELSYYGNCLLPHYVMQSVVVTSLQVLIADRPSENCQVSWQELMDLSLELCEILSQEFILCKPCQDLEDYVRESIHKVVCRGWIQSTKDDDLTEDQIMGIRMSRSIMPMDSEEYHQPSYTKIVYYNVNQSEQYVIDRQYLQTVLRPLIDVYSTTAECLPELLTTDNGLSTHVTEPAFVEEVLNNLKRKLATGNCKYGEALSTDAIKNCLRLFRMWGVVEVHTEGRLRSLSIAKPYQSPSKLRSIHRLIARFRTEDQNEESTAQIKR